MLVAKTQHIELQFCVNYEILYLDMLKYGYPFALVSELLDQVSEALIFTNLTHCNSHHNIQIQAGDKWKTAMPVDNGDVKYWNMIIRLTYKPATFQPHIDDC